LKPIEAENAQARNLAARLAGRARIPLIAARPFRRVFNLADYVQVKQASFQDGLLVINLVREVPESMKPRRIEIGAGPASSLQIEQKKAA